MGPWGHGALGNMGLGHGALGSWGLGVTWLWSDGALGVKRPCGHGGLEVMGLEVMGPWGHGAYGSWAQGLWDLLITGPGDNLK